MGIIGQNSIFSTGRHFPKKEKTEGTKQRSARSASYAQFLLSNPLICQVTATFPHTPRTGKKTARGKQNYSVAVVLTPACITITWKACASTGYQAHLGVSDSGGLSEAWEPTFLTSSPVIMNHCLRWQFSNLTDTGAKKGKASLLLSFLSCFASPSQSTGLTPHQGKESAVYQNSVAATSWGFSPNTDHILSRDC